MAYTSAKAKINGRVGVTHGPALTFVLYFCLSFLSSKELPVSLPFPGPGPAGLDPGPGAIPTWLRNPISGSLDLRHLEFC